MMIGFMVFLAMVNIRLSKVVVEICSNWEMLLMPQLSFIREIMCWLVLVRYAWLWYVFINVFLQVLQRYRC